jgi:hypothetical protein
MDTGVLDYFNKKLILDYIKIIHNDVCSLLPKLDLIEHEFQDCDVICISESHLDKSIDNDKITLKSFQNPVRLDRNRHVAASNTTLSKFKRFNIFLK